MLKRLHKIFLVGIIFCALFCISTGEPAFAKRGGIPVMTEETTQDLTFEGNDVKVKDLDIDPLNTDVVKRNIVPDTKKESKKLIGLFIKIMMLVAFCSIIVFIVLFLIKKFYGSTFVPSDEEYENAEMLELLTPETKAEALRSFLNRTK